MLLIFAATAASLWQIARFTEQRSLEGLHLTGELRVRFYAGSLRDNLEKFRHLPYVLARDSRVLSLLLNQIPPIQINPHLEDFAHASGALIFVVDEGGTTVATSNWRSQQSLMGHNFSFRPYFAEARAGRPGAYYAEGFLTRQPGFFLSYPVKTEGRFIGAIVVKVNLDPLQAAWREGGETVIVSDASGIIFLSSKDEWRYRSLRELPEETRRRLQALQYLNLPLPPINQRRRTILDHNILEIEGVSYLEQARQIPEYGWRIHYLSELGVVRKQVRLAIVVAAILTTLLFSIVLFFRERRQKFISLQEADRAKAISEINERLLKEIANHKATEADLRKTQKELVQAGKLAALGRMSAAIAHELNQPVTAIRTFAASCRVFMERNQPANVLENLDFIARLTERMAKITGQLKTFARKSRGKQEKINPVEVIERIVLVLKPQIENSGALLHLDITQGPFASVAGDSLQLEQVLGNLIDNALYALRAAEDKQLFLRLHTTADRAVITVTDTGSGITTEAIDTLFDPFFTTKEIGEGLGLGLSISYGIIRDMGGTIRAENIPDGGACFTIELPLSRDEE